MKDKKYSKSFEIALSALSCAVAVLSLWLGTLNPYLLSLGYLAGIIALMLPLTKGFFMGDFLAYVGTVILTLLLGALSQFWKLVPFIMFFGLHPLANSFQVRFNINKWLSYIIKAVWFDCTLLAGYFLVFNGFVGFSYLPAQFAEVFNKYIYAFIFTLGTAIFYVYDFLAFRCQIALNALMDRIRK